MNATVRDVDAAGTYDSYLHSYNWAYPDNSILEKNEDGTITLFYPERTSSGCTLFIRDINTKGETLSSRTVALPGAYWGGCVYKDDDGYRYVATCTSSNPTVWCFTRISPDWKVAGTARIKGSDSYTIGAFMGGNCDMVVQGDYLYVHTSRYRKDTHQSNITFVINKNTMTPVYVPEAFSFDHISHSFNQFIRNDNGRLIEVDHGDAYTRSIRLQSWQGTVDGSVPKRRGTDRNLDLLDIKGKAGENVTGVILGGFELGKNHDIVSGLSIHHDRMTDEEFNSNLSNIETPEKEANTYANKDVFISLIDNDLTSSRLVWLTDYSNKYKRYDLTNHKLVKISDDRFLLVYGLKYGSDDGYLFDDDYDTKVCWMIIDSDGNILSNKEVSGDFVCNSEPVVVGNTAVWTYTAYSKDYGTTIIMQTLDISSGKIQMKSLPTIGKDGVIGVGFKGNWTFDDEASTPTTDIWDIHLDDGEYLTSGKKYTLNGLVRFNGLEIPDDCITLAESSNPSVIEIMTPVDYMNTSANFKEKGYTEGYPEIIVKAKKAGTSTITLMVGGRSSKKRIVVKDNPHSTSFISMKYTDYKKKKRSVKMSWHKVFGADGYEIMLANSEDNWKKNVKRIRINSNTTSKTIKVSDKYNYGRIRSYRLIKGRKLYSGWGSASEMFPA